MGGLDSPVYPPLGWTASKNIHNMWSLFASSPLPCELDSLCPVGWTGQPLPCELDSSGRPLAMALFQVALDNIHMAKMWSGELDRSICNFYDRIQYGRKQIVKDLHDEYHRMPGMVAWGKFFAHLCLKWLAPRAFQSCYAKPERQSAFLEAWYVAMSSKGSSLDRLLAQTVYQVVLSLHNAFASTGRDHKPVKDMETFLALAQQVREDEGPLIRKWQLPVARKWQQPLVQSSGL